jgi:alpha-galactosidase
MARAPSSWTPSLAMVLLVVAAAAVAVSSEAARVPAAVGNWTGEELRGAAARRGGRRSRRRAFENGLGRTPQMGYVHTRRRRLQRSCYTFLRRPRAAPLPP